MEIAKRRTKYCSTSFKETKPYYSGVMIEICRKRLTTLLTFSRTASWYKMYRQFCKKMMAYHPISESFRGLDLMLEK